MSPIYTYRCDECNKIEECIRAFAEADEPIFCKKCGAELTHVPEIPSPFQWKK